MITELIEGKNIGCLPDPFPFLSNNKILKVKNDSDITSEYREMYNKMNESLSFREIKVNDVISGTIVDINNKEYSINVGYKDYVYVDIPKKGTFKTELLVGDSIDVLITKVFNKPFLIKGSVTELIKMKVHNKMQNYFENDIPLIATVKNLIPAGYTLDIHMDNVTVEAFMPNTLAGVNRLLDSSSIIGNTFEVMLETMQQDKGVYVVSRRKYLQSLIPSEIKKLKTGVVYTGVVTGTTPFGVFVQFASGDDRISCLTGMVHKANINEEWRDRIHQIKAGMTIDFYVKEIIKKEKIILTQILKESLWDDISVGKVYSGVVKDIKTFGALISLDDEDTMGLIQNSVINKSNLNINIGDTVKVKVSIFNREDKKIYLNFVE